MRYWLSTEKFTVLVETDEWSVIVATPPYVRVFIGQPIANLIGWMRRMPGFVYVRTA